MNSAYLRRLAFTYSPNNDSIFFYLMEPFANFHRYTNNGEKSAGLGGQKPAVFLLFAIFFNVPINETQLELPETFIRLGTAPPLPNPVC